jgi:hypothetical protein
VPYRNPIVDAAIVIAGLEDWFPRYTAAHSDGLVAPQGSIGAVQGGWPHKPAFVPAATDVYVDLRVSPRCDPMQVKRELGQALAEIRSSNPGLEVEHEMILSIPGTHTDPSNWIVQSLMRAWEWREGRPHQPIFGTSGATDAAILRSRGIPTARLGLPRTPPPANYPGFSMGAVTPAAMKRLTECLVYAVIDTCTRDRSEVGLGARWRARPRRRRRHLEKARSAAIRWHAGRPRRFLLQLRFTSEDGFPPVAAVRTACDQQRNRSSQLGHMADLRRRGPGSP